ncbi:hypothetical protein HDU99_010092 [Rhizoclosmatium hyalinum]|nr:hypothetical protein HDU99_010092 [Rhizoclosmatium hyalinum]
MTVESEIPTPVPTPPPSSDSGSLPPRPSKEAVDSVLSKDEVAKVKKVNFWGWVDVGFSHGVDDYDRTPIETDPLTREGAIEVLHMRMEMRKVTNELQRWREEYELAINGALQSDTLTDAPATLSPTTHESFDFPEKPDIALRRAQSTAALASSFGADDATPGSQSSNTAAAMAQLLRRYPPVAPSSTSSLKDSTPATSMYPKPQYPTHLLPRRKQSSPQLTTPSSPSSTTPQRANSMPTAALSITTPPPTISTPSSEPPVPRPRPRPQKSGSGLLSGWNVLDRPHSHAGTSVLKPSATPPITPSSLKQSATAGSDAPVPVPRKRDPSFVAGVAAAAAAGARWTWNEALAREHQKEVEGQEELTEEERKSGISGLVGFWKSESAGKKGNNGEDK